MNSDDRRALSHDLLCRQPIDVLVVGGGPAGLMAALAARSTGAATLLLEKGNKLGRKLGISGGGRCNVTNAKPLPALMDNIPGNRQFLYSALSRFSNTEIVALFERLGIRLKEEDRGRVFPVSDQAATVVRALVDQVFAAGVEVWLDNPVRRLDLSPPPERAVTGVELRDGTVIAARTVILATGGCSVPQTGSTGDAYPWAVSAGHTLVDPYPTEVPLTSDAWFIRQRTLQGISLRDVVVSIVDDHGKRWTTEEGDLIFTHFGLSGPVALRCSHYVSTSKRQRPQAVLTATVNLLPSVAVQTLAARLRDWRSAAPKRQLATALEEWLPARLCAVVCSEAGVDRTTQLAQLSATAAQALVQRLTQFFIPLSGTLPLAKATVTGGGVSVREIQPTTMASKCCSGLYFAGEVMDVHAHTGGYNITVAFATGHVAGTNAAQFALYCGGEGTATGVSKQ